MANDLALATMPPLDVLPTIDVGPCAPPAKRRWKSYSPAVASCVLHLAAILTLGCWAGPAVVSKEVPLALQIREAAELPSLDQQGAVASASEALTLTGSDEPAARAAQLTSAMAAAEQAQPLTPLEPTTLDVALEELTSRHPAMRRGGGPGGAGTGPSEQKGDANKVTGRFFDAPLTYGARSFVFVVDASGSMHGPRFARAQRELLTTLEQLEPHQQFYVVFFNEYDFPQFHPQRTRDYLPATPENIRKVRTWMAGMRAAGDTHPMSAVRKGLELRPDALYLLSDGAFELRTLSLIRQFNKHGTVIHTIGLEDPAGEMLLKTIAEENRGEYHFVK